MGLQRSKPLARGPDNSSDDPPRPVHYPEGKTVAEAGLFYLRSRPGLDLENENWRQGSTSHVHRSVYEGRQAAVKQYICQPDSPEYERAVWECLVLRELSPLNKRIVRFLGSNTEDPSPADKLYPYLITEFHGIGTAREVLDNSDISLPWPLRLKMLTDIAEAVEFLHGKDIVHLDLTCRNCLVSSLELKENNHVNVKVFDFGNSRDYKDEELPASFITTPTHAAPEQISQSQYNEKVDVYSFSMIMFEFASRNEVYPEGDGQSVQAMLELVRWGRRPDIPDSCILPQQYVELMKKCWSAKASDRPSFTEIVERLRSMTSNGVTICQPRLPNKTMPLSEFDDNVAMSTVSSSVKSMLPQPNSDKDSLDGLAGRDKTVLSPNTGGAAATVQSLKSVDSTILASTRKLTGLIEKIAKSDTIQSQAEDRDARRLRGSRLDDYEIIKLVGESQTIKRGRYGCNSIVYQVKYAISQGQYVLKVLLNPYDMASSGSSQSNSSRGSDGMSDEEIERLFKSEYDLPCRPHRNIVRVLHHFCDRAEKEGKPLPQWPECGGRDCMFLVIDEYDCNLQTRSREMRENGSLNERWLLQIFVQIINAIQHLASSNVLHRDLKLDNILIKREGDTERAALCDFGCTYDSADVPLTSANCKSLFDSKAGNVIHHSPELATVREDSRATCDVSKADLWAVGLMCYEAITGHSAAALVPDKRRFNPSNLPELASSYSKKLKKLLCCLMSRLPSDRPTPEEAVTLCCVLLYGPPFSQDSSVTSSSAQSWLDEQLTTLYQNDDLVLLKHPLYLQYLYSFDPNQLALLVQTHLM